MSLTEKLAGLMARPGQDPNPRDEIPIWLKYSARGLGTVGGFIAIFLGVFACTSILLGQLSCLFAGVVQMLAGFGVLVIEAPCCCLFIDFVQSLSDWVDRRPYWNRSAAYIGVSIFPIVMCFGTSTVLGSGCIFGTGILYGMMALGKKASAEEMRSAAIAQGMAPPPPTEPAPPLNNAVPKQSQRAALVDNAQPMAFTGLPHFDSNV